MSRDWDALRQRLSRALAAMGAAGALTPEQARTLMATRAAALARASRRVDRPRETIEILTFDLGGEHYAVEAHYVQTVVPLHEYGALPHAPAHFVGLSAVRGELVAIVDLRQLLHVERPALCDLSRLIVLGTEQVELAILADQVHEVTTLAVDELRPAPDFATGIEREYLRGISGSSLVVLDGRAILDDQKLHLDELANV
jgi:purine-binding chemotaxis protein CheW